ncbi:MAG: ROK family protein [Candidatus Latescibacterota bacterium]
MTKSACAIGVDLGGHSIKLAVVDETGKIRLREATPTYAGKGKDTSLAQIVRSVQALLAQARAVCDELVGIGIGAPGLIDVESGTVRVSPNFPGWVDVPLRKILEDVTELPARIGNDANMVAMGENAFGAGKEFQHFICATLGTGIGGAIVIDGKVVTGADGTAGEIGHTTVYPDGPLCNCGNHGCLERLVGIKYIVERALSKLERGSYESLLPRMVDGQLDRLTPKLIAQAAEQGDLLAQDVFEETGTILGIAFANLVNILNPEAIVLGGGVSNAGELIFAPIRETIQRRAMSVPRATVQVVPATLGHDAGMIGASLLVR